MTTRWEIVHTTTHEYPEGSAESQNEIRVCPATDAVQSLLHHRTQTTPAARVNAYEDYWGTRVETFGVRAAHDRLVVTSESSVIVGPRPSPPDAVALDDLLDADLRDEHAEFLAPSPLARPGPGLTALADAVTADDVVALAYALRDAVREAVRQDGERTAVGTPVEEVLSDGHGVGQDRAHVFVAAARSKGLPATYVSGIVAGEQAATSTHAWVEVLVPGFGWYALDPSSEGAVDERYVTVGRGRDYGDVPPSRGVYVGGPEQRPAVEIRSDGREVERPAPQPQPQSQSQSQSQSRGQQQVQGRSQGRPSS